MAFSWKLDCASLYSGTPENGNAEYKDFDNMIFAANKPGFVQVLLLSVCFGVLCGGCDNTFSPKQDYQERVVVFAVLDKSADYQIVRLESTYDAEGTNPDQPLEKRIITDATVRISKGVENYQFSDTVIQTPGGTQKKIWINRHLRPQEGQSYLLEVEVPGLDPISAETLVPSKVFIRIAPPDPQTVRAGVILSSAATSSIAPPKGYYFRLFVLARKDVGGQKVEIRREVPIRYNPDTDEREYPKPSRSALALYPTSAITMIRAELERDENALEFELVGHGYSFDTFLYSYFQTVRGFDDPVSVRMDRPDVTNIRGGVGVFGALVPDSLRQTWYSSLN